MVWCCSLALASAQALFSLNYFYGKRSSNLLALSFHRCRNIEFKTLIIIHMSSHVKQTTRVDDSSDFLSGPNDALTSASSAERHLPTAPPPTAPDGAFVGDSHLSAGRDSYNITG